MYFMKSFVPVSTTPKIIQICIIVISLYLFIITINVAVDAVTIAHVCLGVNHGCASFSDNKLKCWGMMYAFGQSSTLISILGDVQSEIGDSLPYINIGNNTIINQVSCGGLHTCFRVNTGFVRCIGDNTFGQSGLGIITSSIGSVSGHIGDSLPSINLGASFTVLDVTVGLSHSCVRSNVRKVKCYGNNNSGQLGYGDTTNRGTLTSQMGDSLAFVDLGTSVEAASVQSGPTANHNCVVLSKPTANAQRVKCWGLNDYSQLGYGDQVNRGDNAGEMGDALPLVDFGTESRVKSLSLGASHTCALLYNDGLKCLGRGVSGQLASGSSSDITSIGNSLPLVTIDSGKTIKLLSTGNSHTCIVYDDMTTMKCSGLNDRGQLGQDDTQNRGATPTTIIPSIPAIQLGLGSLTISSIYSGQQTNCLVLSDSSIKCFGENSNAQCLVGTTTNIGDGAGEMGNNLQISQLFSPTKSPTKAPTRVPTVAPTSSPLPQREITSICTGSVHTCISFGDRRMKCWGLKLAWGSSTLWNDFLGDEPTELGDIIPFVDAGTDIGVLQVFCGGYHICLMLDTGEIKCLGFNIFGQLGLGIAITPIGSASGYAGDNLPVVDLGAGLSVLGVALGPAHSCVLLTRNKVKCFGYNYYGQLGYGDIGNRGILSSQMGDSLPFIDLGTDVEVASIHSGSSSYHNCVLLSAPTASAQRIKCWGLNDKYQLGYGDKNSRGDQSGEMGDNLLLIDLGNESRVKQLALGGEHTCALLLSDLLKCWGSGQYGQLGLGPVATISETGNSVPFVIFDGGKRIKYITAGYWHTCISYDDGITMKCFGANLLGQLSQGDTTDRGNSISTAIPNFPAINLGTNTGTIKMIISGVFSNCVLFDKSLVKCFGDNSSGQLGIGSTTDMGNDATEIGDGLPYAVIFSPTKYPTNRPTITPTTSPTHKPSASISICTTTNKKKCKKDKRCKWAGKKCFPL